MQAGTRSAERRPQRQRFFIPSVEDSTAQEWLAGLQELQQTSIAYLRQRDQFHAQLVWVALAVIAAAATIALPTYCVATGLAVLIAGTLSQSWRYRQNQPKEKREVYRDEQVGRTKETPEAEADESDPSDDSPTVKPRVYRFAELQRAKASLLAKAPLLIVGSEGSGKSFLVEVMVNELREEGFTVVSTGPATPKQMFTYIAEQLGLAIHSFEGKIKSVEQLMTAISAYFLNKENTAILIIDDVHRCDTKFRNWLKILKQQQVPMLLLATNPPRSDIFLNLPRLELTPLPDYAIRELMEQAALQRNLNLKHNDLARLQERAGGNPMLAMRVIDEEYLGLDTETGDHGRYFDMTPVILLVGVLFVVMRFVAVGAKNPALYVLSGAIGALFLGASRAMRALPKEDGKFRT